MKNIIFFLTLLCTLIFSGQELPQGFAYLENIAPSIKIELRYLSDNNFIGKPIEGYKSNCLIVSLETADLLKKIQQEALKKGFTLKIFDAYRPQQAVDQFVKWAKILNDTLMKRHYYPAVAKSELLKQGYIASKSGHSRGSTVDITLINTKTEKELDMGSAYDFFGIQSHPFFKGISKKQKENRMLLRTMMVDNGFQPYANEWWHFTLKKEPFPKTYFNFCIN
ncbi:MAG: D-alanyl-D-alanine dipeptidase [Polaribacter sp.]|jgi:D-alanyl-D-alanine dipeptidase